ncbi:hypothetical protein PHYPSEUDO_004109 [Phytophthora pseudosyringae]|uniref:Myb-like domain-containing protein n=1 Tax=Phytophthora pseudosyringae TaxID=221518 RepID=A0A8T1WD22_9STRA|nr:hypothetical protein PHYPSEUDO_004109 [Phytophthora pseudosyringae]
MISPEVMQELLSVRQVLHFLPESTSSEIGWTEHEQHLFWVALAQHPQGPWTTIAEFIGTKSARQAMTHGQKLRQKLKRWNERLRSNPTASMLMDEVSVSTSPDLSVTAGISVGATIDAPMGGAFQSAMAPGGELTAGLMVDGASIVEVDGLRLSDANMMGPNCVETGLQYPRSVFSPPHVSEDTTRVVQLMLSEFSEEVTVTDFSDDPEMLPQDLLDDLLDILSDDDLNELNHHHHHNPNLS